MSAWVKRSDYAIESNCGTYRVAKYWTGKPVACYSLWCRVGSEWHRIGNFTDAAKAKAAAMSHQNAQEAA